jgi:hypothetical protein
LQKQNLSFILLFFYQYPTAMKNQTQTLQHEGSAQLQARMTIQRLQKFINDRFPNLNASARTRLIIECLIEFNEEQRLLAGEWN